MTISRRVPTREAIYTKYCPYRWPQFSIGQAVLTGGPYFQFRAAPTGGPSTISSKPKMKRKEKKKDLQIAIHFLIPFLLALFTCLRRILM